MHGAYQIMQPIDGGVVVILQSLPNSAVCHCLLFSSDMALDHGGCFFILLYQSAQAPVLASLARQKRRALVCGHGYSRRSGAYC